MHAVQSLHATKSFSRYRHQTLCVQMQLQIPQGVSIALHILFLAFIFLDEYLQMYMVYRPDHGGSTHCIFAHLYSRMIKAWLDPHLYILARQARWS